MSSHNKGTPKLVFSEVDQNQISPAIDLGPYGNIKVQAVLSGTGVSVRIRILSGPSQDGIFVTEENSNADQVLTDNATYSISDLNKFVKIQLDAISGTAPKVTVYITPFTGGDALREHVVVDTVTNPVTINQVTSPVTVDDVLNPVSVVGGILSSSNSSATPLEAGTTFTGVAEYVLNYASITVSVWSSHASATNGLCLEFSSNGVNWDIYDTFTVPADKGKYFTLPPKAAYFRVRYVNGAVAQTGIRLQTVYHYFPVKHTTHKFSSDLVDDESTELVRAVLTGRKPDGTYTNAAVDNTGRVITAPVSAGVTVKGFSDGRLISTNADGVTAVRASAYIEQTANAQRSIVSSSNTDTALGTGARTVKITYFTSTLEGPYTETISLNGTTPVNTVATNICFIERMDVMTVGSGGANAGAVSLKAAINGGGVTIGSIVAGDNKTFWAHHYIKGGAKCSITGFSMTVKGNTQAIGFLRAFNPLSANNTEQQISDVLRTQVSSQAFRTYLTPIEVVGPSRVTAYILSDSNSPLNYYGSFDFYEE